MEKQRFCCFTLLLCSRIKAGFSSRRSLKRFWLVLGWEEWPCSSLQMTIASPLSLLKVTPCTRSEAGRWRRQIFLRPDHLSLLFKVLTPPEALTGRTFFTSRAEKEPHAEAQKTSGVKGCKEWAQRRSRGRSGGRTACKTRKTRPPGAQAAGAESDKQTEKRSGGKVQRLSCADAQIPNKKFPPAKPSYLEGHF